MEVHYGGICDTTPTAMKWNSFCQAVLCRLSEILHANSRFVQFALVCREEESIELTCFGTFMLGFYLNDFVWRQIDELKTTKNIDALAGKPGPLDTILLSFY